MKPPRLISQLVPHQVLTARRMQADSCEHEAPLPVVHDHASLGVILEGSAELWCGARYVLAPGDVLLVPEGMPHYALREGRVDGWGISWCSACAHGPWAELARALMAQVRAGACAVYRLKPAQLALLCGYIEAISEEQRAPGAHSQLYIDGLMALILATLGRAELAKAASSTQAAGAPQLVGQALAFIEENALAAISLREVARAVGRSAPYVAALVSEHTGRTVVDWITHGRMSHARQLLARSDETVEAIAQRVGFVSPSHFHRTFKRYHQLSPGQWRQAHREQG